MTLAETKTRQANDRLAPIDSAELRLEAAAVQGRCPSAGVAVALVRDGAEPTLLSVGEAMPMSALPRASRAALSRPVDPFSCEGKRPPLSRRGLEIQAKACDR